MFWSLGQIQTGSPPEVYLCHSPLGILEELGTLRESMELTWRLSLVHRSPIHRRKSTSFRGSPICLGCSKSVLAPLRQMVVVARRSHYRLRNRFRVHHLKNLLGSILWEDCNSAAIQSERFLEQLHRLKKRRRRASERLRAGPVTCRVPALAFVVVSLRCM